MTVKTWATAPSRSTVSIRTTAIPRSGREREGRTSRTSASTCSTAPGRVGAGQEISPPAPISPPAIGSPWTARRMVIAAVCQPLATSSPKKLPAAASASVWNGWGSHWLAKATAPSASSAYSPVVKRCPTLRSSR